MRHITALMLLALLAVPAIAASTTSNLSWTAPETRADGTPITAEEIAEYRVYYAVDEAVTKDSTSVSVEGTALGQEVTIELAPRAEDYTVNFAITAVDAKGQESDLSNTATKVFNVDSTAAPSAPTNIQFTVTCGDGCAIEEVIQE